ncbi:hypothetical protein GCM10017691_04770 [Pseudonocardia petroleophila]|uniref:Uncharacterized protein n=1 Tax=Pseudonocardia petroleophila TaxID=37331 RepID=A0A7G7MKE9_9PSEU|nr:gephyrin-like molybdotransferase receptor GlpR [Pseudonocardia petroleophila]QNG53260.1 hypothetical protein H6H00_04465 [Pseudonocardia petroleophila]
MPSSLIFVGLVVLWLLILVPAVARHQQEVARPSYAALSGRVLDRPQRRYRIQEVDDVDESDDDARGSTRLEVSSRIPAARTAPHETDDVVPDDDHGPDAYEDHDDAEGYDAEGYAEGYADGYGADGYDDGWERPAPRYRPGRGGFDPEAAAITARARYAFRQRVVLGLLVTTGLSALIAVIAVPALWWLTAVAGIALVGYLVYLRRQVKMEEAIRDRRAARMAGTRRPPAAEDPELDEWARRGQEAARPAARDGDGREDEVDDADDELDEVVPADDDPDRVTGTGEPIGPLRVTGADAAEQPALPRLTPAPPPAVPAGTTVVGDDLDDPALHDLEGPVRPDYRRAAGE